MRGAREALSWAYGGRESGREAGGRSGGEPGAPGASVSGGGGTEPGVKAAPRGKCEGAVIGGPRASRGWRGPVGWEPRALGGVQRLCTRYRARPAGLLGRGFGGGTGRED